MIYQYHKESKKVALSVKEEELEFSSPGTLYFSSLIMTVGVYAKQCKVLQQFYPVVILQGSCFTNVSP